VWQLFLGKNTLVPFLASHSFLLFLVLCYCEVGYIYTPASGATASTTISGPLTADPWWGVIAAGAFSATEWFGSPPPFTIVLGALGGLGWFGVVHR
jgi:hypothetical protein